jgi:tyrosyl-tRNA synthetase
LEHVDLPAFSPAERRDLAAVSVVSDAYRKVFQLEKSHSEISRLIKQGSVEIDGTKIHDPKAKITLRPGQILRLDRKRAVRIR